MSDTMLGGFLDQVRRRAPLIHNITNYVTANDCANITLACGASPIMAQELSEVEEITALSKALVINIGTLMEQSIPVMLAAGRMANEKKLPVILDPVGVGASRLRTDTVLKLLQAVKFTVIRGNKTEIKKIYECLHNECSEEDISEKDTGEKGINEKSIDEKVIDEKVINEKGINEKDTYEKGIHERGINERGINEKGINEKGINETGINERGINEKGINEKGINEKGISKKDRTERDRTDNDRSKSDISEDDISERFISEIVINENKNVITSVISTKEILRGVDASASDTMSEETLTDTITLAGELARMTGSVIVITGAIDIVAAESRTYIIRNGCSMMSRITGSGCMLTSILGAFCGANSSHYSEACAAAVAVMGIAGELAYTKVIERGEGTASFRSYLIDTISILSGEELNRKANIELINRGESEEQFIENR